MNFFKCLFVFLLVCSSLVAQHETQPSLIFESQDQVYKELTLSEWKRFKSFEQKLDLTSNMSRDKLAQLRNYAKDSIQILGVKLMAIRLLNEKELLDRDISENPTYYASFLTELRDSSIPHNEYLFLEEKMAYLNQEILEQQLGESRWLNIVFGLLCLGLIFMVLYLKVRSGRPSAPELSKQEVTVRNLILQGKSNKEIANELFISLSTVKSHITNLYGKLNVSNRQELFQKSTGAST